MQRRVVGEKREPAEGQGLGCGVPAYVVHYKRQVIERHEVLRIQLERGAVGGLDLGPVELRHIVVVRLSEVALERRESVAMPEGLRRGRGDARGRCERVAQDDRELAVRHRERRVQCDGFLEQGHGAVGLPGVVDPDSLRVLPQRGERARRDLLERLARADGLERLADALAQPLRQPVDRVDDRPVVPGVLAQRDELPSVRRRDQLG